MESYWTVADADGRLVAIVRASSDVNVMLRLKYYCGIWDARWRVGKPTREDYAGFTHEVLNDLEGRRIYWFKR
jgi:hypothetical protein